MSMKTTLSLGVIAAGVALAASALFIVDERQKALVLQFGEVRKVIDSPGLDWKIPLIQNVVFYDGRILGLQSQPLEVTPLDDRRLVVDAFVRWRIINPVAFYEAVGTGGIDRAQNRLDRILNASIREVLGAVPSNRVLSEDRVSLMNQIRDRARVESKALGVEVIDIRLTRTDLPDQNLASTFARMRAEREREAADEIARGGEAAQRVRATADRMVVELTSDARRQAEVIRGESDAKRNAIYAEAFGKDPEFFSFTRSLTSYERALQGSNSSIALSPTGEFFKYFKSDKANLSEQ